MNDRWEIYDTRTGKAVGINTYPTADFARDKLDEYQTRDSRGGRPDLHESIPHWSVRRQG